MGTDSSIAVELVFAAEAKQRLLSIDVAPGTTVRAAISASQLVEEFPEVDFSHCPLGVWGKRVADDRPVQPGDRIEAYRPLRRDPRNARRELALQGKSMGGTPPPGRPRDSD